MNSLVATHVEEAHLEDVFISTLRSVLLECELQCYWRRHSAYQ